jgi:hypothetical protein
MSANADAVASFTRAIELLLSFPDDRERMQRELPLQLVLMQALIPAKGWVGWVPFCSTHRLISAG